MALKLYNTLTHSEQVFTPRQGLSLKMPQGESLPVTVYACGPTVYAPVHLGNWRTFLFADWLTRALKYLGFEPKLVMNITDVDDKTIAGAREARLPLAQFTKKYEDLFLADRAQLHILPPAEMPHATLYVSAMIKLIETLMAKGLAYQGDDGVYFAINKSENYGNLVGNFDPEAAPAGGQGDFVLWKLHKPEDGDVSWDSPWGKGRPGWHLECSAMIKETLGETIDIHTGGSDLVFPHHTNEIAQSEGANSAPLARFWLHGGFLNLATEKMSKSLGNIFTLGDLAQRGFIPLAYRYFLLGTHYRKIANFTWEALEGAQTAYQKLLNTVADWQGLSLPSAEGLALPDLNQKFIACLEDDINLPQALALVWELIKDEKVEPADKLATLLKWDEVLGLNLVAATQALPIPERVQKLVAEREAARQVNDWSKADQLRDEILQAGYTVADAESGPKIRLK